MDSQAPNNALLGTRGMSLCSNAAMIIFYDIAPDATNDHDDWHTHEHMPERLSIPGFLRGSRWTAVAAGPRYLIMYEVAGMEVLSGAPYLERLNNPTPWTSKIMSNVRGMVRGFCKVQVRAGFGLGASLLAIRYVPSEGKEHELREWLARRAPEICSSPGIASMHLFEPGARPSMTKEQMLRGRDAEMPCVVLVTGYIPAVVEHIADDELSLEHFRQHGSANAVSGRYQLAFSLSDREVAQGS